MKLLILVLLALTGCATIPSEYGQGCRDALSPLKQAFDARNETDNYCDRLEIQRNRSVRAFSHGRQ